MNIIALWKIQTASKWDVQMEKALNITSTDQIFKVDKMI
jgi:hypothetical protein